MEVLLDVNIKKKKTIPDYLNKKKFSWKLSLLTTLKQLVNTRSYLFLQFLFLISRKTHLIDPAGQMPASIKYDGPRQRVKT